MKKQPIYDFLLCWKTKNNWSCNKCFTNEQDALEHAELILRNPNIASLYLYYPDGQCRNFIKRVAS